METNRHVYSFYGGFSEEDRNAFISAEPDWSSLWDLCETYDICDPTARKWIKNKEVEYLVLDGTTYVERVSFVVRAYGVVTRCPVCHRVVWQQQYRRCCSFKCSRLYSYLQKRGQRKVYQNMWLIHPQSVMTFGGVVHRRKMQIHRSVADYEDIVGESKHYLKLIEGDNVPPPVDDKTLNLYAKWLEIDITSEAYLRFVELARREALLFIPREIYVDVKVRQAGRGFIATLVTNYDMRYGSGRVQGYGTSKKLAVSNLESLLKIDVADRLRKGWSIFKLKGYKEKEVRVVISDSWQV